MSWETLAAEENDLQPTPPIGWNIHWFPGGDQRNPVAAIVTAVEGPGKIAVVTFPAGGWPVHHKGVHYIHHPVSKREGSPLKVRNGSWAYMPDTKIPREHNDLHKEVVAKKRAAIEQAEADRKKKEEQGKKPALATV